MGITVEDFKYVRGVNDAEYIELLKNAYERQKHITSKAIAKLKEQPEIIRCGECTYSNKEYSGEMWCGICNGFGIDENSFCSFAERRTDGS